MIDQCFSDISFYNLEISDPDLALCTMRRLILDDMLKCNCIGFARTQKIGNISTHFGKYTFFFFSGLQLRQGEPIGNIYPLGSVYISGGSTSLKIFGQQDVKTTCPLHSSLRIQRKRNQYRFFMALLHSWITRIVI